MNNDWWRIGTYLPSCVLSNETLHSECPEFSEDYSREKLGIVKRHIADNESCIDMAYMAVQDLWNQGVSTKEIDLLLVVTQTPDYPLPSMSCVLQHKLGLNQQAACFDINMGCSGYVYALATAYAFMKSRLVSNALIITSERYSKYLKKGDYQNRAIFGDGATATYLSGEMVDRVSEFDFSTDGSGYDAIMVQDSEVGFAMNGQQVMGFAVKQIPRMVKRLLEKSKLSIDDIDYFVFHQGNKYMIKTIQHRLHIDDSKIIIDLEDKGNTVSSSIPFALSTMNKNIEFPPDARILLCGFGVGLSIAGMIISV